MFTENHTQILSFFLKYQTKYWLTYNLMWTVEAHWVILIPNETTPLHEWKRPHWQASICKKNALHLGRKLRPRFSGPTVAMEVELELILPPWCIQNTHSQLKTSGNDIGRVFTKSLKCMDCKSLFCIHMNLVSIYSWGTTQSANKLYGIKSYNMQAIVVHSVPEELNCKEIFQAGP